MEEKEEKGKKLEVPEDWAEIPIQDYFDKGFRPYIRKVGERRYITLKGGRDEKSLGPYDEERWKLLASMYPHKMPSFPSITDREEMTPIDERIQELREKDLSKEEIVHIMHGEGYPTTEMMKRGLPIRALGRKEKEATERGVMAAIQGRVRGEGYLDELKNMIRAEISRTRELTELFYDIGLGILLASLRKSGMTIEEFRKFALERGALRESLTKASETAFKALEYYKSDLITKVEAERDEARAEYSLMSVQLKELMKRLDPKFRLERMIHTYLLSGGSDANVLATLIDKWLGLEVIELRKKVIAG